jgi:hypothetical protein
MHRSTEIKYIYVTQAYENFAEITKKELTPNLACSNRRLEQAKSEQAIEETRLAKLA